MNPIKNGLARLSLALLLVFSNVAFASPMNDVLPHYNLIEFNIAFILGLSLPVLVIIGFLQPILAVSWRYPALMTLTLLAQFYALLYLQQFQTMTVLATAATFLSLACLWLVEQQGEQFSQSRFNWLVAGALLLFISLALGVKNYDVYPLWLGYIAAITAIAGFVQFSAKNDANIRVLLTWGVTASYSFAVYLWLNVELNLLSMLILAVLSYIANLLTGCWAMVQRLVDKFAQIKLAVNSSEPLVTQPDTVFDPITNLPTYQQGLAQLTHALRNQQDDQFVAIVFKPLNFEQVNKILGHQNSDILLLQLAYSLQKKVSDNPLLLNFASMAAPVKVCRLQGLDFLVVVNASLSNHPINSVVEDICQQLNKSVPQAVSFKSFSLSFELAFGIALQTEKIRSSEALLAQASDALLEAERSHQQICYFDQQASLYTQQQLAKMEKLKQDVKAEKLNWLAYPQVSLSDGKLSGVELAIDWRDNEGTVFSSKEFHQIAEFSGEIHRISRQLVQHAFSVLKAMHDQGAEQKVAINLSSSALLEPDLADFIEQQSLAVGVDMQFLTIEISEQVLLGAPFRARMMIDQLRVLGINIAIDDFSGSYEALRYLRRASIQQVNIECSQLDISDGAQYEKPIVNALINVIRQMNIPIVATGINNQEIAKSYLLMGGNVAQGKAVQSGIHLAEINNWLTAWQARKESV
ncbi:hypothetical protein tinsulaeT_14140 [Thalassotalea insulae]|uniref:EAL domain-containing protein n=1 Tax=Thalassotalea insulae TaxID=2056778 RepID=A0ABQ6GR15_9GAMM|nr:GGDEF domain-containing phosphodiesterase [Thalassotalea insulae]GLX78074.1 hypothetical protein tinsulaeT_14140 [Thalassotalea insulae]